MAYIKPIRHGYSNHRQPHYFITPLMLGYVFLLIGLALASISGLVLRDRFAFLPDRIVAWFYFIVGFALMILGILVIDAESSSQIIPFSRGVTEVFYSLINSTR